MEVILIGLGKMGSGIAMQLFEKGYDPIVYNRTKSVTQSYRVTGFRTIESYQDLAGIDSPKLVWLMISHEAVDDVLFSRNGLCQYLKKGDIIVDAGNSNYNDTKKRYAKVIKRGLEFVDIGVSGGPSGARNGACMMVGGDLKVFQKIENVVKALCLPNGYEYLGGSGAGHYAKMIHNGIEYGMMQSIAEGFAILKESRDYNFDLQKVARVYNTGSVIESRLMKWLEDGLKEQGENLEKITGSVAHSGEGEWTVKEGEKLNLRPEIISKSLDYRIRTEKKPTYAGKILSLLRKKFGGHNVWK